jgi:hypothetical protein
VAFSVNVRLVENRVKSHEGSVKVVKVITQYKMTGITFTMDMMRRTKSPSHEDGGGEDISADNFEPAVAASLGMLEAIPEDVVDADRASKVDILLGRI